MHYHRFAFVRLDAHVYALPSIEVGALGERHPPHSVNGRAGISIHGCLVSLRGYHTPHPDKGRACGTFSDERTPGQASFKFRECLLKDRAAMNLLPLYQDRSCS